MATMDIIKLAGASPRISSTWAAAPPPSRSRTPSHPLVGPIRQGVFINVFGGILRVDRLAEGIIAAVNSSA